MSRHINRWLVAELAAGLLAGGCAGSLSHKADSYEETPIAAANRKDVDAAQAAAADETRRVKEAESRVEIEEAAVKGSKATVEAAKQSLEVTKREISLDEAKGTGNAGRADARIDARERELALAEKEMRLSEAKVDHAKRAADEAKMGETAALAKVEVEKAKAYRAQTGKAPEDEAALNQQLVDAETEHDQAKKDLADAEQRVKDAEGAVHAAKARSPSGAASNAGQ